MARAPAEEPQGPVYRPELISAEAETELLSELQSLRWDPIVLHGCTARRSGRHFGLDYDYEARTPQPGDPIPGWLRPTRDRAAHLAELLTACASGASSVAVLSQLPAPQSISARDHDARSAPDFRVSPSLAVASLRQVADDRLPTIFFASAAEWERWLEDNHAGSDGLWIKIAKKDAGIESVHYPEVLDNALCFGWIDGRREALDELYFLQRFTPRRSRSRWSRINCERVERLTADARMRPAGLSEVQRAKADGRWEAAYDGQKSITVPDDLQRLLDARPKAKAFFAELSGQKRYAILYRLQDARKPETRAKRLVKFVEMLEAGETIHP